MVIMMSYGERMQEYIKIVNKHVGKHSACFYRSSTLYVLWHFVPPQDLKRGRVS